MEPPRAHVRRRATPPGDGDLKAAELQRAASVAAFTLAVTSSGEAVLLCALLGVAAGEVVSAAVAVLAALTLALRWGTTSLDAVAGAQTVLGPAGLVGPPAAAAAGWCAAAALVLARPGAWAAPAFGAVAALVVAGPSPASAADVAVRVAAALAGAALAFVVDRRGPGVRPLAVVLAVAAGALAAAS